MKRGREIDQEAADKQYWEKIKLRRAAIDRESEILHRLGPAPERVGAKRVRESTPYTARKVQIWSRKKRGEAMRMSARLAIEAVGPCVEADRLTANLIAPGGRVELLPDSDSET